MRDGDTAQAIVDESKEWAADLIIVGPYGYTGIKRMLLGGVAQAVLDNTPCLVEVVHWKHTAG